MVIAPVLWSTAGVLTRHVERAAAFEQVFWRSFFAFVFIFAFLVVRRSHPLRAVRAAGMPGLLSGAMWAAMFTAFVVALSLTTTANTLVTMSVSPLLTALFARLFLSDPLPLRTWVAAAAAAVGIAWMFSTSIERTHLLGMLVALLIPLCAAINVVTLRAAAARRDRSFDLVPAVMLGGAFSCVLALPFALPFQASAKDIGLLAFLGFFQLGLPCMLLVVASRTLLAPEIALLGLLEVVLGPLWAWLGAGEVPAESTLLGGLVVLGALVGNELSMMRLSPASRARP
jgi:drug/metabolite transporter (DMT)-like permease